MSFSLPPLGGRAGHRSAELASLDAVGERIRRADIRRLENGMVVGVLPWRRAPVVASSLAYRVGAREEPAGQGGTAHFLEHMMFKGSERFPVGEIDRQTRALGGSNNAFTSHDLTLYYFTFAADRWQTALDIELDRMTALRLDPAEVESERQVILEELSMYRGEPWDALDEAVQKAFFVDHPYGRPVIGSRAEIEAIDARLLDTFHQRYYRPGGAVLTVVGDVDPEAAHAAVARRFADLPAGNPERATPRPDDGLGARQRLERRHGELARLMIALPAPAGDHPDHPLVRLLLAVLGSGRSCRLHRALVDEGQLCMWVSCDVQDTLDPSMATIATELVPGVEPERVEAEILRQLDRLLEQPPSVEEIARAQRMIFADWVFGHERVNHQSFLLSNALALFDLDFPTRYLERLLGATPEDLLRVAGELLDDERRSLIGWSLPSARPDPAEHSDSTEPPDSTEHPDSTGKGKPALTEPGTT